MSEKKYVATRVVICIKKIFINEFTWWNLENYFNLNRTILQDEMKEFFRQYPDGYERFQRVLNKEMLNQHSNELTYS